MSWQAVEAVRGCGIAPNGTLLLPGERHILLLLASYHNEAEAAAWPSVDRIAAESGYTTRRVRQLLQSLQSKGALSILVGGGRSKTNGYLLTLPTGNPEAHFTETPETLKPISLKPETYPEAHFTETRGNPEMEGAETLKWNGINPEAHFSRKSTEREDVERDASSSPSVLPSSEPTETPPRAAATAAPEKPAKTRTPKSPKPPPAVTNDFQDAMVERFGPALGEERVRFEISRALAHDAARKYNRHDLYVEGWLRREAERAQQRPPPSGNQNGKANGPPSSGPLKERPAWLKEYEGISTEMR